MEALELDVKKEVESALVKENITKKVLAELKTNYGSLKIDGVKDKKGYELVKNGLTNCRTTRKLAEKICKEGREPAILTQKAWIAKEKEITGAIKEIEDHLNAQKKPIDDEKERLKEEKARKDDLPRRKELLESMELEFSDEEILKHSKEEFEVFVIRERGKIQEAKDKALKEKEAALAKKELELERQRNEIAKSQEKKVSTGVSWGGSSSGAITVEEDDKTKLLEFAAKVDNVTLPLLESKAGMAILEAVKAKFSDLSQFIKDEAEQL